MLRKNLLVVRAVFEREMKLWFRYPAWFLFFLGSPYLLSGLFYGMGMVIGGPNALKNFQEKTGVSNAFLFFLIGSAMFMVCSMVMDEVSNSIRHEQLRGTFELHYLTPANKAVLWGSVIIPHGLTSSLLLIVSLAPALIYEFKTVSPLAIIYSILVLFLGLLPLFGIGLILAALVIRYKEPWPILNVIRAIISNLSGFLYPITIFPAWLQFAAQFLPTTLVLEVIKSIFLYERELVATFPQLTLLFLLCAIYPPIGYFLYRRWEDEARRKGELSKY